jgi:hypothetical protein
MENKSPTEARYESIPQLGPTPERTCRHGTGAGRVGAGNDPAPLVKPYKEISTIRLSYTFLVAGFREFTELAVQVAAQAHTNFRRFGGGSRVDSDGSSAERRVGR